MSKERSVLIRFEGLSQDAADVAAEDLRQDLLALGQQSVTVERIKENAGTQDLGATLAIILGTQAAIELAKGIHHWLKRRADQTTVVVMEVDGNRVIARGTAASGIDWAKTAEAMKTAPPAKRRPPVGKNRQPSSRP